VRCDIDWCEEEQWQRQLCSAHYQRKRDGRDMSKPLQKNRKNGEVLFRDKNGKKQCVRCRIFYQEQDFTSHKRTLDLHQPYCKICVAERMRIRKYKIDDSLFKEMLRLQGGSCAICKSEKPDGNNGWHLDHDHSCCEGINTCGKCVRGILCSSCNKGLGHFRDSPELMQKAIWYLKREIAREEVENDDEG